MMRRNHYEAVQAGVFEAVDGAIRNATGTPSADHFFAVKDGVREAVWNALPSDLGDALRQAVKEAVAEALAAHLGSGEK
jgi:hypothetical protein